MARPPMRELRRRRLGTALPGALLCTALIALTAACASSKTPDLHRIYDRAAQDHRRNPVVLIPGILGSRLRAEDGTLVWGAFGGGAADIGSASGARLFALPMDPEGQATLDELRDDVFADGALDRLDVSLFGIPLHLSAYRAILGALGVGGYRDEELGMAGVIDYGEEHFTCFQFDYDWRRSIDENARALDAFLREKREYVETEMRARYGELDGPVKFDLVGHSMGGLVARWHLRYGTELAQPGMGAPTWAGAELVERLILVGTPNAGSVDALLNLVYGVDYGLFLPFVDPAVIGTMPSVYQLLPRGRHGTLRDGALPDGDGRVPDLLDPALWREAGWGLAAPEPGRALGWLLADEVAEGDFTEVARKHLDRSPEVRQIIT